MKLAVMMAAYNAEPFIADALASILAQRDAAEIDIIVVNDGSTDGTGRIVANLANSAPQIRLIETENRGVTNARNAALAALEPDTDLVTFLDADDLVATGRYQRDLALFAADPNLDLVYGSTELFKVASSDRLGPAAGSPTLRLRSVQLAAGIYRYELITKTGLFDTRFRQAEDMDYLLRIFESQPRYHILPDTCLYYRRHGSNMTHNTAQLRRDFARALMLSVQRRRMGNLPPFPKGLFDIQDMAGDERW
jgi:glycosyltransferase involved in cell wall biosynthesis